MKYILGAVLVLFTMLHANSGEEIFEKKCVNCHQYYIPQSQIIANAKNGNRDLNLSAPTLTEISFMLKGQVGDRTDDAEGQKLQIEEFLTDYLDTPTKDKGVIPDEFTKFFEPMPSMKGQLNEDEIEILTDFIYEYAEKMTIEHSVKRHTYEEAVKIAKAEGKIILIEGFIPYCRGCIKMDREVMVDARVKNTLEKDFVFVKKNLLIETLPLGMKRLGTPSFYFIDAKKNKVIDMLQGTGTVDEFLEMLESIKKSGS